MNAFNIQQQVKEIQDASWIEATVRIVGDMVLCPMCEVWHENNSNCQRND